MNIRSLPDLRWRLGLASIAIGAIAGGWSQGDDGIIPRNQHPWARFRENSWKQVKVTTETFDKDANSLGESVTETYTRLVSVDAKSYELQIDVTVEVAGKRLTSPPRTTRQGFHGESEGQEAVFRRLGPAALKIGSRAFTAQTAEVETSEKDSRRVTLLHYGAGIHPYVLARRSLTFNAEGKVLQETHVQTLALQTARTLLGMRLSTWETRTTQKHAAGTVVTDEVHCFDVPGGVVEHSSEEQDEKGVVRRRSKLELVNYGIAVRDRSSGRRHHSPRKTRRQ